MRNQIIKKEQYQEILLEQKIMEQNAFAVKVTLFVFSYKAIEGSFISTLTRWWSLFTCWMHQGVDGM